jgi:hypothetical protein
MVVLAVSERGDAAGLWLLNVATGSTESVGARRRSQAVTRLVTNGDQVPSGALRFSPEERRFELVAVRPRPGEQRMLASASGDALTLVPLGWGSETPSFQGSSARDRGMANERLGCRQSGDDQSTHRIGCTHLAGRETGGLCGADRDESDRAAHIRRA